MSAWSQRRVGSGDRWTRSEGSVQRFLKPEARGAEVPRGAGKQGLTVF